MIICFSLLGLFELPAAHLYNLQAARTSTCKPADGEENVAIVLLAEHAAQELSFVNFNAPFENCDGATLSRAKLGETVNALVQQRIDL